MTLRDPEDRRILQAAQKVRQRERKARKAAAIDSVRALRSSAAPGARQPRQRDNGYLALLRRLPCAICGSSPSDAAHTRFGNPAVGRLNPGMGAKPHDRFATPLCRTDHEAQHAAGNERAWWASHGVDPDALSASLFAAYLAGQDGAEVIARFQPATEASTTIRETARHSKTEGLK